MALNKRLKSKIVQFYGTQADFAPVVDEDESVVSRVLRGRRLLPPERQKVWAKALRCKSEDLFP